MLNLILVLCVSSAVSSVVPLSLSADIQPVVVAPCNIVNTSGLTCRNCNTLARCVLMNNVWESYDVDNCDTEDGFFCDSFEQRCSNSTGPCNRLVEFACSEEGYFPNPFSCQEYYSCIRVSQDTEIVPFRRICEIGAAYSVATETCTLKIQDPICLKLQWQCAYPGDMGLWPGSDNIFYLCLRSPVTSELVPELHKCTSNHIFDGANCVPRNAGPSTPPPGSNSTEPNETTSSSPLVCTTPGLFPTPGNCQQYIQCDSNLGATLHDCPEGTHFIPGDAACSLGSC